MEESIKTFKCPKCGHEHVFAYPGTIRVGKVRPHWDEVKPGGVISCLMCGEELGRNDDKTYVRYLYTKNKEE